MRATGDCGKTVWPGRDLEHLDNTIVLHRKVLYKKVSVERKEVVDNLEPLEFISILITGSTAMQRSKILLQEQ